VLDEECFWRRGWKRINLAGAVNRNLDFQGGVKRE
jgi:hypothetical protein